MNETIRNKEEAMAIAMQGESYRGRGNISAALTNLSAAIAFCDEHGHHDAAYGWMRAHRGAAWGELSALDNANADFDVALQHRPENPWIYAQRGEAYRVYIRDMLGRLKDSTAHDAKVTMPALQEYLGEALAAFDASLEKRESAWTYAHRGATHSLAFWLSTWTDPPTRIRHGGLAIGDFTRATTLNRTYPWALAFHAFQLSLMNDFEGARQKLGEALLADVGGRLVVLRGMTELYVYKGEWAQAVQNGWLALQKDPEDTIARYFLTEAMAQTKAEGWRAAVDNCRSQLLRMHSLLHGMLGGLAILEGKMEEAKEMVEEIIEHPDLETIAFVQRDPAWRPLVHLVEAEAAAVYTSMKRLEMMAKMNPAGDGAPDEPK
jgi:tetratricopeptide (TPR) repeat protein